MTQHFERLGHVLAKAALALVVDGVATWDEATSEALRVTDHAALALFHATRGWDAVPLYRMSRA